MHWKPAVGMPFNLQHIPVLSDGDESTCMSIDNHHEVNVILANLTGLPQRNSVVRVVAHNFVCELPACAPGFATKVAVGNKDENNYGEGRCPFLCSDITQCYVKSQDGSFVAAERSAWLQKKAAGKPAANSHRVRTLCAVD